MPTDKLLELEGLTKYFYKPMGLLGRRKQVVQSVDHVSFHILRHETFGLVGESGCGKSTLGRTITRLYEPTEGKILYDGTDISHLTGPQLLPYRKRIQMIFQDPYASLDSRMTVMDIIREALDLHSELTTKEQRSQRVYELLDHVGLMREHANRYPHEFSGGQRQRIGIAKALSLNPSLLVCDEPVSALDVSIQAQILNLLKNLQKELDLTSIFIGHGLGAVNYVSDRIAVMYLGQIVELADSRELFDHPLHPYSKALFDAVPLADPRTRKRLGGGAIEGEAEILPGPGEGCPFYPRCPRRSRECSAAKMELRPASEGSSHLVSCIHAGQEGVD